LQIMTTKKAGQIFKQARNAKGLTQAELAEKSGIHWNTIAKIERGEQKPEFDTIKRLAKVLELNVNDIPS
jgi:transcriptional regulator with XRE-family HTH domain